MSDSFKVTQLEAKVLVKEHVQINDDKKNVQDDLLKGRLRPSCLLKVGGDYANILILHAQHKSLPLERAY